MTWLRCNKKPEPEPVEEAHDRLAARLARAERLLELADELAEACHGRSGLHALARRYLAARREEE